MLIMNVYMPCDKNNNDHEYIDVLNMMSQLCYKYNPNHVVIGDDFNVDFSRNSANIPILQDFITDFSLFILIYLMLMFLTLLLTMIHVHPELIISYYLSL